MGQRANDGVTLELARERACEPEDGESGRPFGDDDVLQQVR